MTDTVFDEFMADDAPAVPRLRLARSERLFLFTCLASLASAAVLAWAPIA
jgi:hypothetical protein